MAKIKRNHKIKFRSERGELALIWKERDRK